VTSGNNQLASGLVWRRERALVQIGAPAIRLNRTRYLLTFWYALIARSA
jgi:hypothetical protein